MTAARYTDDDDAKQQMTVRQRQSVDRHGQIVCSC
jgi:hypothetical protein